MVNAPLLAVRRILRFSLASPDSGSHPASTAPAPAAGGPPAGFTVQVSLVHPERWGTALLLVLAVLFNLVMLYPELVTQVPPLNDNVLHLLNLRRTAEAFSTGQTPTDSWLSQVALGYPLFHQYQHLAYLLPGLLLAIFKGVLTAEGMLRLTTYLLLSIFPLSLYWSGRRLGLDRLPSVLAAALGPLLATRGLYGLDAGSYIWSGYGLYTQLWAMLLFPMALAQGYHTLCTGKSYLLAVVLVAATLLTHLVYGYMLLLSLGLLVLLGSWRKQPNSQASAEVSIGRRAIRLAALLGLVALVTAYFWIPFFRDLAYMNRSVWEISWKYDSFGAAWVITRLINGGLFDAGRFPSLTLLFAVGVGFCIWRWREERYRMLLVFTLLWLLLFFGRPTWDGLLDLLPMSGDLQLHRFIGGFQLGGIYLIGIGLAALWNLARARRNWLFLLAPVVLSVLLLIPVYRERIASLSQNGGYMSDSAAAVAAEQKDLDALESTLRGLPPGRVYAGLAGTWGKDVKVGAIPLYALLNGAGFDTVGYLYHALSLNADIEVLFNDARVEQYNLFDIRYVVTLADWTVPNFYTAMGDFGRFRLYQVETNGYFDLVGSDTAFVGTKSDFYLAASTWLASGMVDAKQHPTISLGTIPSGYAQVYPLAKAAEVISATQASRGPVRGLLSSEMVTASTYQTSVTVERESYLMLKVTYHPNWHAYVDGVEAGTVMLMPSYIGVKLAPGEHQVRLVYQPGALRGWLEVVGLLILLLLALAQRWPGVTLRLLERLPWEQLVAWTRRFDC